MTSIDFSELIPERLVITNLPDGSELELINRSELGPEEMARIATIQKRIETTRDNIQGKTDLDDEMLDAMEKINGMAGEILQLLAPGMVANQLGLLKMGMRQAIIDRWSREYSENGHYPKAASRRQRSSKRRG